MILEFFFTVRIVVKYQPASPMKPKNQMASQTILVKKSLVKNHNNKENRIPYSPMWKAINVKNYKVQINVGHNEKVLSV